MGFDLFSRGQWDDFRVWFFAGSDVCFIRFVYLIVRTQVPPQRGEPRVYLLCVSGHCSQADWSCTECVPFCFLLRFLKTFPLLLLLRFVTRSSHLVIANLHFPWCLENGLRLPHVCRLAHGSDCPPAAVLASRLSTRLFHPHSF